MDGWLWKFSKIKNIPLKINKICNFYKMMFYNLLPFEEKRVSFLCDTFPVIPLAKFVNQIIINLCLNTLKDAKPGAVILFNFSLA